MCESQKISINWRTRVETLEFAFVDKGSMSFGRFLKRQNVFDINVVKVIGVIYVNLHFLPRKQCTKMNSVINPL